jgi:DNA-binding response OmpR family regulator
MIRGRDGSRALAELNDPGTLSAPVGALCPYLNAPCALAPAAGRPAARSRGSVGGKLMAGGRGVARRIIVRAARRGTQTLRFRDLVLDPETRAVRRAGRSIELTPIEFSLLELFLRNPRKVLTRGFIFNQVWGFDFGPMSNSLNVYIGYLRRKTEAAGEPRLIYTVRGVGYTLHEP